MQKPKKTNKYTILILTILISGCYYNWSLSSLKENPNPAKQQTSEFDSTASDSELINNVELQHPFAGNQISQLTELEKLDSTAQLIEIAASSLAEEQFTTAGYWFALAKVMLSNVKRDEISEYIEYYQDLVIEINNFYMEYVAGIDVLPKESPPEAIMAGIDEAEGDTAHIITDLDEIDIDSLKIEIESLTKPEVAYDSTALEALLDTVKTLPPVPLVRNKKVNNAIKFFKGKGRKVYNKWLERAGYYIPVLAPILKEVGLPEDIVFLAMIESGFNPKAYSYAHASGPWQFISSTARIFGLKVGWWYDERRDPVKSTHAAARYLKKLYTEFDDWYLALAAYNCGEGKVRRHVRRYGTDFWRLKRIPRQTRNYVPTFIAAAIIAKNPTEYGFKEIEFKPTEEVDSLLIKECYDLESIAKLAGTNEKTLSWLNPVITRWCTPPDKDEIWIYLPKGSKTDIAEELKKLPPEKKRRWVRHKVRRGEALSTIARRYGTTVRAICDVKENRISNRHRIRAGKVLNIPVPSERYKKTAVRHTPVSIPPNRDKIVYTVQRGDNLSLIAKRYGTTVSALRRWNKLYRKRYIHPGQKLTVWIKPSLAEKQSKVSKKRYQGPIPDVHIVKRGETAWDIARYYSVSLQELLNLNNLSKRAKIKPGDKLNVPKHDDSQTASETAKPEVRFYTVRKGDTLWDIAREYNITISELKMLNKIRNHKKIKPGDRLILPTD